VTYIQNVPAVSAGDEEMMINKLLDASRVSQRFPVTKLETLPVRVRLYAVPVNTTKATFLTTKIREFLTDFQFRNVDCSGESLSTIGC
jgi:hypothetical protein